MINYGSYLKLKDQSRQVICGISIVKGLFPHWFNEKVVLKYEKKILKVRDFMNHEIWQEPTVGSSSIWCDNWTKFGALYLMVEQDFDINEEACDIDSLITEGVQNEQKMIQILP